LLLGPMFVKATAGSLQTGRFEGKMIVAASLWDREAMPWQADWYRQRVTEHLGGQTDQHFRLWYSDHALHGDEPTTEAASRVVSYVPVLHQALRDLAAWVEQGTPPPASTNYRIVNGQVVIPPTAVQRRGIQPVVTLMANGSTRADVRVGEPVTFTAKIELPPRTGKIIAAQWDFEGTGTFPVDSVIPAVTGERITVKTTYAFTKPGTYFPAIRAVSERQGNRSTPYARIQNLGRVRIVVR
jgi:hypothetical protein